MLNLVVEQKRTVMAHAQKPDLVFQRNGRVHLYRRGCQFSRLLAAEVCDSAVVMLDRPCPIQCTTAATPSIRLFPLHFSTRAFPCAITFRFCSTKHRIRLVTHSNPLLHPIPRDNVVRRLKRRWPADLSYGERDLLAGGDLITLVHPQVCLTASPLAYRILCTLLIYKIKKRSAWGRKKTGIFMRNCIPRCNNSINERQHTTRIYYSAELKLPLWDTWNKEIIQTAEGY